MTCESNLDMSIRLSACNFLVVKLLLLLSTPKAVWPHKQGKKEDWSVHKKDRSCPAQLKVSTINKRTVGRPSSNSLIIHCEAKLSLVTRVLL